MALKFLGIIFLILAAPIFWFATLYYNPFAVDGARNMLPAVREDWPRMESHLTALRDGSVSLISTHQPHVGRVINIFIGDGEFLADPQMLPYEEAVAVDFLFDSVELSHPLSTFIASGESMFAWIENSFSGIEIMIVYPADMGILDGEMHSEDLPGGYGLRINRPPLGFRLAMSFYAIGIAFVGIGIFCLCKGFRKKP